MKTVYIAGPITGKPDFNRANFDRMERLLNCLGLSVFNPASLPAGLSEFAYMDICLAMVRHCHAVIMLEGWDGSQGARAEHALAVKLGKLVVTEQQGPTFLSVKMWEQAKNAAVVVGSPNE